jgi:AcrR family transcriptional regulator
VHWRRRVVQSREDGRTVTSPSPRAAPDAAAPTDDIVDAALDLYGARGYAAVGVADVAAAAGTTEEAVRRAFPDPVELFAAAFRRAQEHRARSLADSLNAEDPMELMRQGLAAWLGALRDRTTRQLIVVDGPEVLGMRRWLTEGEPYGRLMIDTALVDAMEQGRIPAQPVRALGTVVSGALDASALHALATGDLDQGLAEAEVALTTLLEGMVRRRDGA